MAVTFRFCCRLWTRPWQKRKQNREIACTCETAIKDNECVFHRNMRKNLSTWLKWWCLWTQCRRLINYIYFFKSHSIKFHSYCLSALLPAKGCNISATARCLWVLSKEGSSSSCHTFQDTGPRFLRSHLKDLPPHTHTPTHSHTHLSRFLRQTWATEDLLRPGPPWDNWFQSRSSGTIYTHLYLLCYRMQLSNYVPVNSQKKGWWIPVEGINGLLPGLLVGYWQIHL